jgi:hypothetical protein
VRTVPQTIELASNLCGSIRQRPSCGRRAVEAGALRCQAQSVDSSQERPDITIPKRRQKANGRLHRDFFISSRQTVSGHLPS